MKRAKARLPLLEVVCTPNGGCLWSRKSRIKGSDCKARTIGHNDVGLELVAVQGAGQVRAMAAHNQLQGQCGQCCSMAFMAFIGSPIFDAP